MVNSGESEEQIPGIRKAAVLMVVMGDEFARSVFQNLGEEEVQILSREISKVDNVSGTQAEKVMAEMQEMSAAHNFITSGGVDQAKKMLTAAFGPERAKVLIERLMRSIGSELPSFDALQKADPQQVAKFIQGEHPQTIALVLSHLNSGAAAAMLMALPSDTRSDVAMRMAKLDEISPHIVGQIAGILEQKIQSLGQFSRESYGGVSAVAEMFNRLEANSGQELLEEISERDEEIGTALRNLMFVFEDMLLIDSMGMREILSRVDKKTLTLALKGTSQKLQEHFFGNMSERGAQMVREDMEAMGPVKVRDVEIAQQQAIEVVRGLEAEGVLSLQGAVGEQYVV